MLEKIELWISQTNAAYKQERKSCGIFRDQFEGFYSLDILNTSYFVVTDDIPKLDFPELRQAGFGSFIDMSVSGITYNDTYYVERKAAKELRLHFHELVHVLQWRLLTPLGFINRYINEIQSYGYDNAPLERMAYTLDAHYLANGQPLNVELFVREHL